MGPFESSHSLIARNCTHTQHKISIFKSYISVNSPANIYASIFSIHLIQKPKGLGERKSLVGTWISQR
ncbi:hypothetical protein EUGRSUZ_H04771 [Eucalyptus grandis]|uniref:Uncharacterized protein n=2 Tax=Eucalyptus grandis TaxID=71139 RepID=A0ACC3JY92_EUCGR|nr:hypothetical protein EUGRSUZ_H04771 [Eucalyptus grandis]